MFPRLFFIKNVIDLTKKIKMSYAAKAKAQQFIKRKLNLMKKADQLARLCYANATLIMRKNERYYIYRSIDHER